MAAHGWRTGRPVIDGLRSAPHQFDFYQALRHLELLAPGATPLGEGSRPQDEAVTLRARISWSFPASAIQTLDLPPTSGEDPPGEGEQAVLTQNFLTLAGATGPLPPPLADLVIERTSARDTAAAAFLDIFHHRLASLMVRQRRRHHPALAPQAPWDSPFARILFALLGMANSGCRDRLGPIPDRALLHYAGLLGQSRRSLHGLEVLLSDFFALPVRVRPFQGAWLPLDDDQRTRLGRGNANNRLGRDTVLGGRVWDQSARIEIRLGPLPTLQSFADCLPDGPGFPRLAALVAFYCRRAVGADLRLVLAAAAVPGSRLNRTAPPRLGWNSWLRTRPATADDEQVRLRLTGD